MQIKRGEQKYTRFLLSSLLPLFLFACALPPHNPKKQTNKHTQFLCFSPLPTPSLLSPRSGAVPRVLLEARVALLDVVQIGARVLAGRQTALRQGPFPGRRNGHAVDGLQEEGDREPLFFAVCDAVVGGHKPGRG